MSLAFVGLVYAPSAHARAFVMGQETFASYLLGTGGPSLIETRLLEGESTATDFSKKAERNMGAEFGFVYNIARVGLRFGFEILKPTRLDGTSALVYTGGAQQYEVDSEILAYIPKVGFETHILQWEASRLYIHGAVGVANVTVKNVYTSVAIAPNVDHTVEAKGTGNLLQGGLGYEISMFDNTTLVLEATYRNLVVDDLKYTKDVTTFSGAKVAGDDYVGWNGGKRTLDFTGTFYTIGFRFWL